MTSRGQRVVSALVAAKLHPAEPRQCEESAERIESALGREHPEESAEQLAPVVIGTLSCLGYTGDIFTESVAVAVGALEAPVSTWEADDRLAAEVGRACLCARVDGTDGRPSPESYARAVMPYVRREALQAARAEAQAHEAERDLREARGVRDQALARVALLESQLAAERQRTWEAWEREYDADQTMRHHYDRANRCAEAAQTFDQERAAQVHRGQRMHRRAQKAEGQAMRWEREYHARRDRAWQAVDAMNGLSVERHNAVEESKGARLVVDWLAVGVAPSILRGMIDRCGEVMDGVSAQQRQVARRILTEVVEGHAVHSLATVLDATDLGAMLQRTLEREGRLREDVATLLACDGGGGSDYDAGCRAVVRASLADTVGPNAIRDARVLLRATCFDPSKWPAVPRRPVAPAEPAPAPSGGECWVGDDDDGEVDS